jgi:hypothetical protein
MNRLKWLFTAIAILSLAILPAWAAGSPVQLTAQQSIAGPGGPANVAVHNTGILSSAGPRQERDSLALAGLSLLLIGAALRRGTRREVPQHTPAMSDALVGQTHLPLAS